MIEQIILWWTILGIIGFLVWPKKTSPIMILICGPMLWLVYGILLLSRRLNIDLLGRDE